MLVCYRIKDNVTAMLSQNMPSINKEASNIRNKRECKKDKSIGCERQPYTYRLGETDVYV